MEFNVIRALADAPETEKVVTVCVVPVVNSRECAAIPVSWKSLKVFEPEIVIFPVLEPLSNHTLR